MSDERRTLAIETFNYVWTLMEKPDRSERETELMIHAAHAQRYLWEDVGGAINHARGEWQVSRAYAVAERPGPALHHAGLCLEIAESGELGPFDVACGHEAVARALALSGQHERAAQHVEVARQIALLIEDEGDRQILLDDLATVV